MIIEHTWETVAFDGKAVDVVNANTADAPPALRRLLATLGAIATDLPRFHRADPDSAITHRARLAAFRGSGRFRPRPARCGCLIDPAEPWDLARTGREMSTGAGSRDRRG
jgi:hypothetical protein